ncbi:hypothetical protein BDAP_001826 [Binucleata daphniae]
MYDYSLNKYHFTESLYDLEFEAKKIIFKGNKIDAWYFLDMYAAFKRRMPDLKINVRECLEYIKEKQRYKIYENEKIENIVITLKNNVADGDVKIIVEEKNKNRENNDFAVKKPNYKIIEDADEVEEFVCPKNDVKYEKSNKQNTKMFEHRKQRANFDYKRKEKTKNKNYDNANKRYNNEATNYKNNAYEKQNNMIKSLDAYECSGSEESNFIATVKQQCGNRIENKRMKKDTKKDMKTYADYKEMMLSALGSSSCFLLTTFHNIITHKHGISFDYKHAPANKRKGIRSKLSLYLDDCDDIFERIQIKSVLFYKRIDFEGKRLIEKRKNTHLRFVRQYFDKIEINNNVKEQEFINTENMKYGSDKYKKTMYHLEILIINMFATKTTADISDIEIIFEKVYGEKLCMLIQMTFTDLLYKVLSPNMILKESEGESKVTLIPTNDIDFKEHGDIKIQEEVINLENKVLSNLNEVCIEQKIKYTPVVNVKIPVKSCDIFKSLDPTILSLLHLSDYNIPKNLHIFKNDLKIEEIAKKCVGDKFGYKNTFFYLQNNLL